MFLEMASHWEKEEIKHWEHKHVSVKTLNTNQKLKDKDLACLSTRLEKGGKNIIVY